MEGATSAAPASPAWHCPQWTSRCDLKARRLGLPLHRLLGAVRDEVPVYASGGFVSYADVRTRAVRPDPDRADIGIPLRLPEADRYRVS